MEGSPREVLFFSFFFRSGFSQAGWMPDAEGELWSARAAAGFVPGAALQTVGAELEKSAGRGQDRPFVLRWGGMGGWHGPDICGLRNLTS